MQRRPPAGREARGRRARDGPHAPSHAAARGAREASRATAPPTAYLESLGVLGPNVLLSHGLGLDDAEIECLARTDTAVAMCPVMAAKAGRGVPRTGGCRSSSKGVRVALGTDSPNNSNHLDLVRAMNMAAIQYKDARQDLSQIPAETALELATLGARRRSGWGTSWVDRARQAGGPRALRHRAAQWQALFNPINNLVYNADGRSVHTVVVDGRVVVDAYRQSFVDEGRLFARVGRRAPPGADRRRLPALALADRLSGDAPPALAGRPRSSWASSAALDATIVGTAMPTVIAALGGAHLYPWLFSIYMLASTVVMPVFGSVSIGSGAAALHRRDRRVLRRLAGRRGRASMPVMVVGRGIQGVGRAASWRSRSSSSGTCSPARGGARCRG